MSRQTGKLERNAALPIFIVDRFLVYLTEVFELHKLCTVK